MMALLSTLVDSHFYLLYSILQVYIIVHIKITPMKNSAVEWLF